MKLLGGLQQSYMPTHRLGVEPWGCWKVGVELRSREGGGFGSGCELIGRKSARSVTCSHSLREGEEGKGVWNCVESGVEGKEKWWVNAIPSISSPSHHP